jgi:1-deoxy-D-xylulose-5-phosphate reductoisomerase
VSIRGITVLGSTGSVGMNTLDVLARHRDKYRVVALTAHRDHERLLAQCLEHRPRFAVLVDKDAADAFVASQQSCGLDTTLLTGPEALAQVARMEEADSVMAAIVGAAGLLPTLAAVQAGKRVLLANKESMVVAGRLITAAMAESGAVLIPIDSEHNAIFQCLPQGTGEPMSGVRKILLTASGGPFLNTPQERLADVTPEAACAHPNWVIGRKISVDSATMMNKGLEIIEACWLFGLDQSRIDVVVHPQSVVHSLVDYVDGSVLAQLGNPDMRTPIAHALAWPERFESGVEPLDLVASGDLEFRQPDEARFPCLRLAREAARAGGTAPAVLNAVNELAVDAFLNGTLRFTAIPEIIEAVLENADIGDYDDLESVLGADRAARESAGAILAHYMERSA